MVCLPGRIWDHCRDSTICHLGPYSPVVSPFHWTQPGSNSMGAQEAHFSWQGPSPCDTECCSRAKVCIYLQLQERGVVPGTNCGWYLWKNEKSKTELICRKKSHQNIEKNKQHFKVKSVYLSFLRCFLSFLSAHFSHFSFMDWFLHSMTFTEWASRISQGKWDHITHILLLICTPFFLEMLFSQTFFLEILIL
jgi:hypothetical protein